MRRGRNAEATKGAFATLVIIVREGARWLNGKVRIIAFESVPSESSVHFVLLAAVLCPQVRQVAHACAQKCATFGALAGLRDASSAMCGSGVERRWRRQCVDRCRA